MRDIKIDYKPIGRQGQIVLVITMPDGETFTDKFDITKEDARRDALARIAGELGDYAAEIVKPKLDEIAAAVGTAGPPSSEGGSQADELVALASGALLFHTPGDQDSAGFAAIDVGEHRETWPINSKAFQRWLAKRYYDEHGKAPNSSALDDATRVLAANAVYDGPEHEAAVRVASANGAVYLDLADAEWRVVEITATGWRIMSSKDAPVWFVRKRGMLALPVPVKGGRVDELRPLLNLADDEAWVLLVGCLVGFLRPTGPYPILIVDGEQGSAKSTTCRYVIRMTDPRTAALRRPPRSERDFMIAATNSRLVGFDNLSGIQPWLSDTICSLATGGGFAARELYSDDGEKLFDAMRPVLLNGIDRVGTRSDLLDRAVHIHLPRIPEESRLEQRVVDARFERVLPRVLGALLDAVSSALRNHDSVKLGRLPRMADFATWVVAAEQELGWEPGTFLSAYTGNREEANEIAIEACLVGQAVLALVHRCERWQGTCKDLLAELTRAADDPTKDSRDWPDTVAGLSHALRRIAPNLRSLGLEVEFGGRTKRGRTVLLGRGTYRPTSGDGSAARGDGSPS